MFPTNATASKVLIYQSDHMEVFYLRGRSSLLFMPFAPMGFYADGNTIWGERPALNLKLSTLGFIARRPNWYPAEDMRRAIAAAREVLHYHQTRVCMGGSMGAYAALKYGRSLGARACIAFSPQYSIDPEIFPENRFLEFFDEDLHQHMQINDIDPPALSFAVYDPCDPFDELSVDRICEVAPRVKRVRIHHVGHESIRSFAGTQNLKAVIEFANAADQAGLQDLAQKLRRQKGHRSYGIAQTAINRRPNVAFALLERDNAELAPRAAVHIARVLGRQFLEQGRYEDAKRVFALGVQRVPDDAELLRGLHELATKAP